MSRRRALGLGLTAVGVAVFAPSALANATVASSIQPCDDGFTGDWHGPDDPYNEVNLGGSAPTDANLITNPSFEIGAPGATAPGWTFVLPPG